MAQSAQPIVFVVVRNRNEANELTKLIRALERQTCRPGLILVDNESTDDSVKIATRYGAEVVKISRAEFSYGRAINKGVEAAPAEFIVLLSSHSLPLTATFIEDCLRPFDDPEVAAAKCLRVDECDRWMDLEVMRGPVTWEIPITKLVENNGCIFRKSVWQKFPFDESLEAAEDRLWSYELLNAGYKIAESAALYKYSFPDRFWASLRRFTRVQVAFYRMRGGIADNPYPLRRLFAEVLYRIPRESLRRGAFMTLCSLIYQTVPWRSRRKARLGSVR